MGSAVDRWLQEHRIQPQVPTTEKQSDVDQWLGSRETESKLGVGASSSATTDPATAARVLRLQSKTGLPEDLIRRNIDAIEADARQADFDPSKYAQASPIVSRWLAEHPAHVALASQDLTKLSYIERQVGSIAAQFTEGRHLSELQDIGESAILGTVTPAQRKRQAELDSQARDPQKDYGITGFFEGIPGAIANQLPIFANTFFGKVKAAIFGGGAGALVQGGVAAGVTALAGQAGPQVATPEEVVTVPAAFLAGAAKGGVKGAGLGWKYGGAIAAGRMEGALAYLEFEKIRDEHGLPLDRATMVGAAGIVGAINGALEMVGFESVAKTIPGLRVLGRAGLRDALMRQTTRQAVTRIAKGVGEAMLTEGATEFMQDVVKNSAGELAAMISDGSIKTASPETILSRIFSSEHIAEAISDARAGAQGGGGMAAAGGAASMVSHFNNIKKADQRQQFFQAIGGELQDSEMLKQMPEKTQEVIERLTKDGPVENLYIPIEEWKDYWQKQDIDPAAAAEEVNGDRRSYQEAEQTGGDITIKTARWAVTIAPSEHNKFFSEVMRLAPDEMNAKEAKALREQLDTMDQQQVEAAAPTEEAGATVQTAIADQLRATGKFTEPQIAAQAQLHGDIFRTLGQRTGQDPVELFKRFGLQINAQDAPADVEGMAQGQWRNLNEQARDEVLSLWKKFSKNRKITQADIDEILASSEPDQGEVAAATRLKEEGFDVISVSKEEQAAKDPAQFAKQLESLLRALHSNDRAAATATIEKIAAQFQGKHEDHQLRLNAHALLEWARGSETWDDVHPRGLFQSARASEWNKMGEQVNEMLNQLNAYVGANLVAGRESDQVSSERYAYMQLLGAIEQKNMSRVKELMQNIEDFTGTVRPDFLKRVERNAPALWEAMHRTPDLLTDFRSKLENLIVQKMPNKTSVTQAKAVISGAKVEERQWVGIDSYLDLLDPQSEVTKQQLLDFARQHRVHLERTNLADTGAGHAEIQAIADDILNDMVGERVTQIMRERGIDPSLIDETEGLKIREEFESSGEYDGMIDDALEQARDRADEDAIGPEGGAGPSEYSDYTLPGGTDYVEEAVVMPEHGFESQHFNVQGIIAHIRRKFRQLVDGTQILHIEEIQSDLHQQRREELNRAKPLTVEEQARLTDLNRRYESIGEEQFTVALTEAEDRERFALMGRGVDLVTIDKAPMAKTWHELAFKATVVEAVKQKKTLITWTTGQQQIDRYGEGLDRQQRAGLRGFYDDVLVRYANKFARSYGSVVKDIKIDLLAGAEDPQAIRDQLAHTTRRYRLTEEEQIEYDMLKEEAEVFNVADRDARHQLRDRLTNIESSMDMLESDNGEFERTQNPLALSPENQERWKKFERQRVAVQREYDDRPGHRSLEGHLGKKMYDRYHTLLSLRQTREQLYPVTFVGDEAPQALTTVHSMEITPEMARAVQASELELYQSGRGPMQEGVPNDHDPIVAAASRTKTGEVFTGLHHGETENKAAAAGFPPPGLDWFHEQGFVTKSGKFLTRRQAIAWIGEWDESTGEELISENMDFRYTDEGKLRARPGDFEQAGLNPDAVRVVWNQSLTPDEQRTMLKAAGLHELSIEEALGKKWEDLQPGVRDLITPAVEAEVPSRVQNGGNFSLRTALDLDRPFNIRRALGLEQRGKSGRMGPELPPRGRIRIGDHSMQIDLFKSADLSTFLHESGHFYLEVLDQLGQEFPDLAGDRATIREWLNIGDGPLTREAHETFARGFEAYLREGRAPTSALRTAFAKFRAWLVELYKSVKNLHVEVSPEMTRVFDRLVATDDEITAASQEVNAEPIFANPAEFGMTDTEAQVYGAAIADARSSAENTLTRKLMREVTREQTVQYKAAREQMRVSVVEEVNADPNWRAVALLTRGTLPDGSALPENFEAFKLSKTALVANYGKEILQMLPRPHVYEVAQGLHPDIAADILGFNSGEELLNVLTSTTESPKAYIERLTDQRTRAQFGELLSNGQLHEEALKAVHNDKRALLLQKELQHLASTNLAALKGLVRKVARPLAPIEEIRRAAEDAIATKLVRDIRPIVYQRAEAKSGRLALEALLKGDIDEAFEHKQRQLLNAELYRAATMAQDRVNSVIEYMGKFNRQNIRDRLGKAGGSYLAQIDAIRSRFDFTRSVTMKALSEREALRDFVQNQHALGFTIEIPEKVMNEAYRQHYKEISLDELIGIHEAVQQIDHLARVKNRLLASSRARSLATAVAEVTSSIGATHTIVETPPEFAPSFMSRLKTQARGIIAAHTKMEFMFEWLDGNKEQGAAWSYLFKPMVVAENAESVLMRNSVKAMRDIFKVYPTSERSTWFWHKINIPGIASPMTKANILAVALNQGNTYNKDALLRGYGWNQQQVDKILATMDARDWQVVQGIWDHLESYWPAIAQLEKDLNGLAPQKVEANEVQTPFGTQRGGYYPIIFDSKLSWRQAVIESRNAVPELFGGQWARAMTRHGHTEARNNTGGKPLLLELSGLSEHIANVAHDLSHRRAVIDVNRIVQTPEVRNAIESSIGREMYRQIHPWLMNVAGAQRAGYVNPIEGMLGRARMGATIANMGWKVTTGLAQFLSYTNTIKEVGPKYAMSGLNQVYGKPWKFKSSWDFVTSRSEFMKDRIESYDRDVHDALKRINIAGGKPGPLSVLQAYSTPVRDSFFMFVGLMDMGASLPTWMGAYSKAMDGGIAELVKGDETAAIDYADKVVRQTQGVGAAKDLANVQSGSEIYKLFTMFYSYFNVLFNQFAKTTHEARLTKNIPRFVASMALLWFMPAALQELIVGRGPSPDDGEDEWLKWLAAEEIQYPFQSVVLLRDVVNGMGKFGYEPSAAFDAFKVTSQAGKAIITSTLGDDEFTRADTKATAAAAGYFFKLPTKQLWLTGEYFYDWLTGEEQPESPVEALWRAAVTGKKRETP